MRISVFIIYFLCIYTVLAGVPDIPKELASEVREYFLKEPQLFQGNPCLFDDVLLTVGRATYNPEKREESRIRARADARAELEKFLKGFQIESRTSSGETVIAADKIRLSKYTREEIRTRICGKQKNVEFFGEWLSADGTTLNIAAGIVWGVLSEPEEKVALKNFQCDERWSQAVRMSRGLHAGGALLAANEKNELFLLASAGARKSIPLVARDTLIRARALARASAFVAGITVEEDMLSVEVIRQENRETDKSLETTFDFKRFQRERTECIARMSKIGSWTGNDGQEEFQIFLLKLSDIWE